jgi:hypothetical protein
MINVIEAVGSPEDIGRSIGTAVADSFADAVLAEVEFFLSYCMF